MMIFTGYGDFMTDCGGDGYGGGTYPVPLESYEQPAVQESYEVAGWWNLVKQLGIGVLGSHIYDNYWKPAITPGSGPDFQTDPALDALSAGNMTA